MATIYLSITIALIIILLYGMVSNTYNKNSEDNTSTNPKRESIVNVTVCSVEDILPDEIRPSEPLIGEDDYDEQKKCIMRLRTMMSELSREQRLYDMINVKSVEAGGVKMPDQAYFCQLLKTVFVKDLKYSYEKMGRLFKISTLTAEGQCLLLIADLLNDKNSSLSEYTKFQTALNPIDKSAMLTAIKYLSKLMPESIAISVEGDEEFAFSAMLINFDADCEYLGIYRSELRKLITCISRVCSKAQVRELEWINQISVPIKQ